MRMSTIEEQKQQKISVHKDVEILEHSFIVGGNVR